MEVQFAIRFEREEGEKIPQEFIGEKCISANLGTISIKIIKYFKDKDTIIFVDDSIISPLLYQEAIKGNEEVRKKLNNIETYDTKYYYELTDISFKDWKREKFLNFQGANYFQDQCISTMDEQHKDKIEVRLCKETKSYCLLYLKEGEKIPAIAFIPKHILDKELEVK